MTDWMILILICGAACGFMALIATMMFVGRLWALESLVIRVNGKEFYVIAQERSTKLGIVKWPTPLFHEPEVKMECTYPATMWVEIGRDRFAAEDEQGETA